MTDPLLAPSFLYMLDRLTLTSRRVRAGTFKGERRSPHRGGSVEFADFREYAPGDDFRQIDWNAYARLERLFLRLFVEEEDATIHVVVDASQSMDWGEPNKWTYARRVAAALGYVALIGMDRLVGAVVGAGLAPAPDRAIVGAGLAPAPDRATATPMRGQVVAPTIFPPHRGKKQALAWFDWLTGIKPGGQVEPASALMRYASSIRRPGPLIVIGDLMDDGWREGIQRLAERRYEVTVLHILSPQETSPELEGDLKLVDSETSADAEITADFDLLSCYRARVQDWQEDWARFCSARAIIYAPIETSLPFEDLVMAFLRQRGILC